MAVFSVFDYVHHGQLDWFYSVAAVAVTFTFVVLLMNPQARVIANNVLFPAKLAIVFLFVMGVAFWLMSVYRVVLLIMYK